MIKHNLNPLIQPIQWSLHIWAKIKLSWFGHIGTIKIKILTQIDIPLSKYDYLKYLWSGWRKYKQVLTNLFGGYKRLRIKMSILQRLIWQGGLAIPNEWIYYKTTMLLNLMQWWKIIGTYSSLEILFLYGISCSWEGRGGENTCNFSNSDANTYKVLMLV